MNDLDLNDHIVPTEEAIRKIHRFQHSEGSIGTTSIQLPIEAIRAYIEDAETKAKNGDDTLKGMEFFFAQEPNLYGTGARKINIMIFPVIENKESGENIAVDLYRKNVGNLSYKVEAMFEEYCLNESLLTNTNKSTSTNEIMSSTGGALDRGTLSPPKLP